MEYDDKPVQKYGHIGGDKEENVKPGLIIKLKDAVFRRKLIHWIWLPYACFTLGVVVSQHGPTFPDIQILTNTDEEKGSNFFTSGACGYMVGSFLAGSVHGKIGNNVVMSILPVLAGGTTILTPYCTTFALMMVIKFICNVFSGGIDTTLNAEHMRLWGNDGQALLQFLHFSFALGGVLGPVLTAPFLAERNKTATLSTTNPTLSPLSSQAWTSNVIFNLTAGPNPTLDPTLPKTTNVHWAFLISGIIMVTAAMPFFIMIFEGKTSLTPEQDKFEHEAVQHRKLPTTLYIFMVLTLSLFYLMYSCVESTFGSYLVQFILDEYEDVTKAHASYIMSFYWGAFAAARFASIFTSSFLTAVRLLYLHLALMLGAYTGIFLSAYFRSVDSLTAFASVAGIAMSAVYPAGFSWTEAELLIVTGRVAAAILIGSSLAGIIIPFILGYLMKNVSNMWFCYILLLGTASAILVFLFLLLFNRIYINKTYGTVEVGRSIEKQIDPPTKTAETHFQTAIKSVSDSKTQD